MTAVPYSHFQLGVVFLEQERRAEALHQFERAIRLNPEHKVSGGVLFVSLVYIASVDSHYWKQLSPDGMCDNHHDLFRLGMHVLIYG